MRKEWHPLGREGFATARCSVARLMRAMGLQRAVRGKPLRTTVPGPALWPACGTGLIRHSDRSVHYVSIKYTDRLIEAGITPTVGSVGDSYDNALAESVIGIHKTEVIPRRGAWRTPEAVELTTLDSIDWSKHRRLLAPNGDRPPAEVEERFYASQDCMTMAA